MEEEKLNYVEASFLVLIILISHIIMDLPNMIIRQQNSSSILNVVYVSSLVLIYFLVINKLFKPFENKNILNVAEFVGGKTLKIILTVIYSLYLVCISAMIIRGFCETLKIIYFPKAALWIILEIFILLAVLANKFGERNIIKINTILMPFILITIFVIFIALLKDFEVSRIFPLLGNGVKSTFVDGTLNMCSFSGLIILFFVKPNLKNVGDYKKVGIMSIVLSSAYLVLSVASSLLLFPFLTSGVDVLSVYLSACTIRFGRIMPRTDALFMFIWIFTFISYLSVIISYIVKFSKESISLKSPSIVTYLSALAIFIVALLPQNSMQIHFFQNAVYKYLSIAVVFVLNFVILLIGYIKKRRLHEV